MLLGPPPSSSRLLLLPLADTRIVYLSDTLMRACDGIAWLRLRRHHPWRSGSARSERRRQAELVRRRREAALRDQRRRWGAGSGERGALPLGLLRNLGWPEWKAAALLRLTVSEMTNPRGWAGACRDRSTRLGRLGRCGFSVPGAWRGAASHPTGMRQCRSMPAALVRGRVDHCGPRRAGCCPGSHRRDCSRS